MKQSEKVILSRIVWFWMETNGLKPDILTAEEIYHVLKELENQDHDDKDLKKIIAKITATKKGFIKAWNTIIKEKEDMIDEEIKLHKQRLSRLKKIQKTRKKFSSEEERTNFFVKQSFKVFYNEISNEEVERIKERIIRNYITNETEQFMEDVDTGMFDEVLDY